MVPFRSNLAMKTRLFCFLLFIFSTNRFFPAETNLLSSWLNAQTNIHTWSADFVQTRTLKSLAQPLTAGGRVWFEAPNLFHWELGSPAQTIAVRERNALLVIYPKLKRAERYPLAGNATGQWRDVFA